jgi:hypothetical protein
LGVSAGRFEVQKRERLVQSKMLEHTLQIVL